MRILLLCLLIVGCSPQQRMNRLLRKHPHLASTRITTYRDTLYVTDTIIRYIKVPVPGFTDSFNIKSDTVIETKEVVVTKRDTVFKIKVKPQYIFVHDTFVEKDTFPVEIKVPAETITIYRDPPWGKLIAAFCFFILAVLVLVAMIRK